MGSDGLTQGSHESVVVVVDVLASGGLGVYNYSLGCVLAHEEGDFESSSGLGVSEEVVGESIFVDCFDLLDHAYSVLSISSPSAVVDVDGIGRVLVSEDLVGHLLWLSLFHLFC